MRQERDGIALQEAACKQAACKQTPCKQGRTSRLQPLFLDVCAEDSITSAVAQIRAAVGQEGLFGLVNNAGISIASPLEYLPLDDLRQQLEVNVIAQIAVTQACLPLLREAGGRIVMMSSTSGLFASPFLGPYAASKFALEALSDSLRVELRRWGIAVVLIEPGTIATPIWEKSLAAAEERLAGLPDTVYEYYGPLIGRMIAYAQRSGEVGLPAEEVARVVAKALVARRPRARYLVVKPDSGVIRRLLRMAPTPLRDWLVAWRLK